MSEKARKIWDGMFAGMEPGLASGDEWLRRWTGALDSKRELPVLELGCGSGDDSRFLSERGMRVVATDFSDEALRLTRLNSPGVETRSVDLALPLPFGDSTFEVVVASLSLHYFSWNRTCEISSEIHRVLAPDGYLLARFNSTSDEFHGSSEKTQLEENFYLIRGLPRRLFDRRSIESLFGEGWEIESSEERTSGRFGKTKTLWEIAVRKLVPPGR